jgi:hypothetical protein
MHRLLIPAIALPLLIGGPYGVVRAQDFPTRKAGLWEIAMTMSGGQMPPQQTKMCIDAATDAELFKLGMNASQGMCQRHDMKRDGGTVTVDAECKMGDTTASTHAVTTFTGDTAYHTDINTKFDPPMAGHAASVMVQDAKWTGPCPADMQPGDIEMANGIKMNVKQMLGGK